MSWLGQICRMKGIHIVGTDMGLLRGVLIWTLKPFLLWEKKTLWKGEKFSFFDFLKIL